MDIGFVSVFESIAPLLPNTFCYYKDKLLKTDINGYKGEIISTTPSVDGDIVKIKLSNDNGVRILDDFLISLTGAYGLNINDIYEDIKIISHTSDTVFDYIECLGVPTMIKTNVDSIDSINLILKSATKFSYGKFDMSWKPRGMCLFEGLNIDIEVSSKDDEDRTNLDEVVNKVVSLLLKSTSLKIVSDGVTGYFKTIGRPSIKKGIENGENVQGTIISFSGYYQINYNM